MAATETMINFLNNTHSNVNNGEQRIAALETQVEGLLKWQQSFISALSFAFSANNDRSTHAPANKKSKAEKKNKNPPTGKPLQVKEAIVTVTEMEPTAPGTPESETSATLTVSEGGSTAPTTPGSETPPLTEVEKATVH
ncbi:MAG: hypothetical protein L6R39_007398, partial [Caloplaca ligustica]